jgi:hypothetical protein
MAVLGFRFLDIDTSPLFNNGMHQSALHDTIVTMSSVSIGFEGVKT